MSLLARAARAAWTGQRAPLDPEEVRRALEEVLSRGEVRRAALVRALQERIAEFLERLFAPLGSAGVDLRLVVALVLGALLAFVLARAFSSRRRGRRALGLASAEEEREARLAALLRRAREAFAAGEHALSLRLWLWALLVGLGEKGELDYRDAWTTRELVERGRPSPAVRARLAPLVDELEAASFGGRAVGAEEASRARELVLAWLAEARA